MPSANHATKGSGGSYCVRCSSSLGDKVKVQPTTCDGETFCPRCFTWWRMNQPSEQGTHGRPRFDASQACAGKCQFCEWTVVSFGAQPGQQLQCSHCLKPGVMRLRIDESVFTKEEKDAIRETVQDGLKAASHA